MTIFYIKMKIRAGGGSFRAGGGSFRAAGCSPLLFLFMGNANIENAVTKICDFSIIKPTCPKENQFGFPLPFPKRVYKQETKYNISDITL